MDIVINEASFENASMQQLEKFIEIADFMEKNLNNVIFIKLIGFSIASSPVISQWRNNKYKSRLFSILNRARSEITDNDFFISNGNNKVKSRGCAISFNFDHVVASTNSSRLWGSQKITGQFDFVNTDEEIQSIENAEINNISEKEHIDNALSDVLRITFTEKVSSGSDFWEKRDKMFGNFIFCGETKAQISNMTMMRLEKLFSLLSNFNSVRHKDSSDTVKSNPKINIEYEFELPDNTKDFFYKHIDLSKSERVHFLFRDDKYYIGYIGKHLRTAKFNS